MVAGVLLESLPLFSLRAVLFFSCRKYLLRSLYSDLQELSGKQTASQTSSPSRESIRLDPLPSPATQTFSSVRKPRGKTETLYSTLSRDIFAGCFSESCILFFLLMLQEMDALSSSTRLLNWRLSLFLLLMTILVLIPFSVSLLITAGPDPASAQMRSMLPRILFSMCTVGLYLFALSCIPLPTALSTSDRMTATLSRLLVVGTTILGLLAGFGAASSSWDFIPSRRPRTTPTDQDIVSAEFALSSVRADLERRRAEAERRASQQAEATWMSRVMPSFRGDENLQELNGLEALEYQMARSLDDLRHRHATGKFSSTFRGRLFNFGGRLFAAYCFVRLISCFVNIFPSHTTSSSTTSYPDVVTQEIAALLGKVWPDIQFDDVARVTHHVSLVLVGVIILTSIRRVLRGVTRALRVTSRNLGASLMLLVLAQLMVIYLLSTIIQLRTSFPPTLTAPSDDASVNLFTTIPEFAVFGSLFDFLFLISATASIFVRWAADKVNGPKAP
ncbi:G protein-coupled receptor 89 [Mycena rebaudengoi]|nr:G protein-coupled receptor 89 [Mycena rebaudengoi]